MKCKPENVKLVIAHDGVEQDVQGFDESTCIQNPPPKKLKQCSRSCKQSMSSTLVKHLTKSEIESLRQNKRDAYALMMKMN